MPGAGSTVGEEHTDAALQLRGPIGLLHHLGTPQKLTDADQAIVWDGEFEPFGEELAISGTAELPLRFPGQYADAETGYSYNYFRDYDPTLGRYLQSDPIGLAGGINTFTYVNDNPLSLSDPTGEFAIGLAAIPVLIEGLTGIAVGDFIAGALAGTAAGALIATSGQSGDRTVDGPPTGSGGHYCKIRCNSYLIGKCSTCPDTIHGSGYGRTKLEAWQNAWASVTAAQNALKPNVCGRRHCHGIAGSCKGWTGGPSKPQGEGVR
jgi:RHS repeat-associated protein